MKTAQLFHRTVWLLPVGFLPGERYPDAYAPGNLQGELLWSTLASQWPDQPIRHV